jgi:hypothetical protein
MIKPNPVTSMLFVFTLAMAPFSLSENVTVITHLSANWAETENEGFAVKFNRALNDQIEFESELLLLPLDRAIIEFGKTEYHCYLGGNNAQMAALLGVEIVSSLPISEDRMNIFTRKDSDPITTLNQVTDLKIGVARGMERVLTNTVVANNALVKTPSATEAFKMLQAERIDAFLSFESSITQAQKTHLNYDSSLVIFSVIGGYNCKKSELTNEFINQVNRAIEAGHADNEFSDLFERYSKKIPSIFTN